MKTSDLWVDQVPCISTAHVPERTAKWLDDPKARAALMIGEFGWLLCTSWHEDCEESGHPELGELLRKFEALGYDYVRFDAAASCVDGFPTFDW